MERQRLNILLIGDDLECRDTLTSALRSSETRCRLLMVRQDRQAPAYLRRQGRYADAPLIDLVLFDARDADDRRKGLLESIRSDPALKALPVVLLTSDDAASALEEALSGDASYTAFSPVDLDSFLNALNAIEPSRFMQAISLLEDFGFVVVRMPEPVSEERRAAAEIRPALRQRGDVWRPPVPFNRRRTVGIR